MALGVSNIFAGNPLDRQGDFRGAQDWAAHPEAIALLLWQGQPLFQTGGEMLSYVPAAHAFALAGGSDEAVFLGVRCETPMLAVELPIEPDEIIASFGRFHGLRDMAALMPTDEAAIAATAKAMVEWRARHRFCGACGAGTVGADAGWKRVCQGCGAQHFPRTDPVAIMLPTRGDMCLMGRQRSWPKGRFSALAGFIEPGESIEEACARELKEEAGLTAVSVRYHSSQPWPFPTNLMLGLIAEVDDTQVPPTSDELESTIWVSRDEARAMCEGTHPDYGAPSPIAIARTLLDAWVSEG